MSSKLRAMREALENHAYVLRGVRPLVTKLVSLRSAVSLGAPRHTMHPASRGRRLAGIK
jgi:hypothetical protein